MAVDVGCGTGQTTLVLAPHFDSVLGCDISKSQIHEARNSRMATNIQYCICPAERLCVPDHSVQLLSAGTCLHWLDAAAFFKEAKRVLCPGGVLAVYSSCRIYPVTDDEGKNRLLRNLTDKLLYEDFKAYRSPQIYEALEHYRNIEFPFDEVTRIHNVGHIYESSAADAVGYIKSMSSFQNYRAVYPEKADHLLQEYQDRIVELLYIEGPLEQAPTRYSRDYCLILCRDEKY